MNTYSTTHDLRSAYSVDVDDGSRQARLILHGFSFDVDTVPVSVQVDVAGAANGRPRITLSPLV